MNLWQAYEVERATWRVEIWNTMIRVHRTDYNITRSKRGKRDVVGFWSKQSRMAMLRFINTIDWDVMRDGWFVTLTYPDWLMPFTYVLRRRHRDYFVLQLERQLCTKLAVIWRTEFEERKSGRYTGNIAPHHHLAIFTKKLIKEKLVEVLWRNCLEYPHGPLETKTKRIEGAHGLAKYLAKYISKYRQLDIGTYLNSPHEFGRQWGVKRKTLIAYFPKTELILDEEKRYLAAQAGLDMGFGDQQSVPSGYTIFGREETKKVIGMIFGE